MKKHLLLFFLLAVVALTVQPTPWLHKLGYNGGSPITTQNQTMGIHRAVKGADGFIYAEIGDRIGQTRIYIFDSLGNYSTPVLAGVYFDQELLLKNTPDGGVLFASSTYSSPSASQTSKLIKIGGTSQWTAIIDSSNLFDVVVNSNQTYTLYLFRPFSYQILTLDSLGREIASVPGTALGKSSVTLNNGNVVFTTINDSIFCYDLSNSDTLWTSSWTGSFTYFNNEGYILDTANLRYCKLDLNTGAIQSIYTLQPRLSQQTRYYIEADGGYLMHDQTLRSFDTAGVQRWSTGRIASAVFPLTDRSIIAGGVFNTEDYNSSNNNDSGPTVYVGSIDSSGNTFLDDASAFLLADGNGDNEIRVEDFLYTAAAFGKTANYTTGPIYPSYFCRQVNYEKNWPDTFYNGVNVNRCNLNNDSIIDQRDIPQWDLSNCTRTGNPPVACNTSVPSITMVAENDTVNVNSYNKFYLIAGSLSMPLDSIFGFSLELSPYGFDSTGMQAFIYTDSISVMISQFGDSSNLIYRNYSNYLFCSLFYARKDNANINGLDGDTIGYFKVYMTTPFQYFIVRNFTAILNDGRPLNYSFCMRPFYINRTSVSIETASSESASISPNPSNGVFTIKGLPLSDGELTVLSAEGKIISTVKTNGANEIVDLSNYPPGFYMINYINSVHSFRYKIIRY